MQTTAGDIEAAREAHDGLLVWPGLVRYNTICRYTLEQSDRA